jgi:hypothetical protein
MRVFFLLIFTGASVCTGVCQSEPPQFYNFGPSVVYPGTHVIIGVIADSTPLIELLAAPANVVFWGTQYYHPGYIALMDWDVPSRAAVGTTNVFVLRATDSTNPQLVATNITSVLIIDPPPIRSIQFSNGLPVLRLDSLLPDKTYYVEWAPSLPSTNWTLFALLSESEPRPPVVTLLDTNAPASQGFYRIVPSPVECYAGAACP